MSTAHTERELHQEILILLFAAEGEVLPGRCTAERILPVQRGHDRLDLARIQPTGVQPADHRSHAGSGDRVDRNVQLLKNLEHTYVRRASSTATGEHESDARPMWRSRS